MTHKPRNELNPCETLHVHHHHTRPQICNQHDPQSNEVPQDFKFCNYCRKIGFSVSICLKTQRNFFKNSTLWIQKIKHNKEGPSKSTTPKKGLKTSSGTTKIYLTKELPKPTSLFINQTIETNPNHFFQDEILLHMTNMTVKIQEGGIMQTLDL